MTTTTKPVIQGKKNNVYFIFFFLTQNNVELFHRLGAKDSFWKKGGW